MPESQRPLLILLFLFVLSSCASSSKTPSTIPETSAAEPNSPSTELNVVNSEPQLTQQLDAILRNPEFNHSRVGVAVISLKDGKLIYQHNGDKSFTPASNMKIFTTAVALDLLGADYRWRTSVYATRDVDSSGTINGDLILYGRGAPDLIAKNKGDNKNSLEELAIALYQKGVRRISGNVVGDESYFRGDPIGEGWQWNDLQWYFGAEASALTINANSADITIAFPDKNATQPKITSDESEGYLNITNNMKMVAAGQKFTLGIHKALSNNEVTVWGDFPSGTRGYSATLSVHRPSLWAAQLFVKALITAGIRVDGTAQYRDSKVSPSQRFDPAKNSELASVTGKQLGEIVRVTNKLSINLFAELLLRTLGREREAMLSEQPPPNRERGDEETGAVLILLWLARNGIPTNGLAIHDGSGLSRLDLVTPQATAALLAAIRRTNSGQVFVDSLPIAGTDGTLGGRLNDFRGQIQAKTGLLTYDNALSGYVTNAEGQTFAFSAISNDFVGKAGGMPLIDRVVSTLAQYPISSPKHIQH